MKHRFIYGLSAAFMLLLLLFVYFTSIHTFKLKQPQTISVLSGWNVAQVVSLLDKEGLWQQRWFATAYLRARTFATSIKAGEYELQPGLTLYQFSTMIIEGRVKQHSVTLVPGYTFDQIMAVMAHSTGLVHTLTESQMADIKDKLGLQAFNLEGQFYPDSYRYEKGDSDLSILIRAHQRLKDVISPLWVQGKKTLPYTNLYQVMIVASLIEKEAKLSKEKKTISGVIVNRLDQKMPLQIDASVIYGLGHQYQGKLTRAKMRIDTPYNTYKHRGLPPSPIAIFSRDTFAAAMRPRSHHYLYYVADRSDGHLFASNYADHLKNIKAIIHSQ